MTILYPLYSRQNPLSSFNLTQVVSGLPVGSYNLGVYVQWNGGMEWWNGLLG